MRRRAHLAAVAAALLAAALAGGCKGKKKDEAGAQKAAGAPASGPQAVRPSTPGAAPDLPASLALDCDRIVPAEVRSAQLAGLTLQRPVIQTVIATCVFSDAAGTLRPSVSLFCHPRKRNWNFSDELARDSHKKAIAGLGRGAYARGDHVFFYPSNLDCLARVIWPGDADKGAALARALDAHLSKSTVTPP